MTREAASAAKAKVRKLLTTAIVRAMNYDTVRLRRGMRKPGAGVYREGNSDWHLTGHVSANYDIQDAWRAWRQEWIDYHRKLKEEL